MDLKSIFGAIEHRFKNIDRRIGNLEKIQLPATSSAAYTPIYYGSTSAGTTTYARQLGYYIKTGIKVEVWIDLSWTNATGTGDARISLPFTSASTLVIYAGALRLTGTTWTGSYPNIVVSGGTNYFILQGVNSNAAPTTASVEAAGGIAAYIVYLT